VPEPLLTPFRRVSTAFCHSAAMLCRCFLDGHAGRSRDGAGPCPEECHGRASPLLRATGYDGDHGNDLPWIDLPWIDLPPPGRGREAAGLANAGATVAPRCFGKNLKIMRLA